MLQLTSFTSSDLRTESFEVSMVETFHFILYGPTLA